MIYSVYITENARIDIIDSVEYIRNILLNPRASYNLLTRITKEVNSLSVSPQRNQIVSESYLSVHEIRMAVTGSYLIFYILNEDGKSVNVIRFLYGKRNWVDILKQDYIGEKNREPTTKKTTEEI